MKLCNLAGPGREISRNINQGYTKEGTRGISPTHSHAFSFPSPLPSRTVTRWGAKFPQSVVWQDSSFFLQILQILQIRSPRLSKGKPGRNNETTTCLWCLYSGPEIRTSGKNHFYLFHPRQPSWKLWRALPFQLFFPYCQFPPCWENGIPLTGNRGPSQRWCQRFFFFLFSLPFVITLSITHCKVYFYPLLFT